MLLCASSFFFGHHDMPEERRDAGEVQAPQQLAGRIAAWPELLVHDELLRRSIVSRVKMRGMVRGLSVK